MRTSYETAPAGTRAVKLPSAATRTMLTGRQVAGSMAFPVAGGVAKITAGRRCGSLGMPPGTLTVPVTWPVVRRPSASRSSSAVSTELAASAAPPATSTRRWLAVAPGAKAVMPVVMSPNALLVLSCAAATVAMSSE